MCGRECVRRCSARAALACLRGERAFLDGELLKLWSFSRDGVFERGKREAVNWGGESWGYL